jgi:diguanylate cyclase (GGDEF)-like protein
VATVALLLTCGRVTNELRALLDGARHEADHDALTGTLARAAFRDELAHRLAETPAGLGLMIVDLDRFGQVNKVHGHAAGDAVLVRAAERVRGVAGEDAVIGRLGGDELALVVAPDDAARIAGEVSRVLSRPHGAIALGASVGLAIGPRHGRGADALLRAADVALRVAKRSGGGQVQAYVGEDFGASGPTGARGALARLIAGDGRSMVVQPIVDAATGGVHAYEVLARFATRGDAGPVHWFALADEFGMRDRLELACLEEALELYDRRPPGVGVTVNLSGPVLLDLRAAAMMSRRGDLSGLTIEVTEETMVRHDAALAAAIEPMLERGATFAVDDIGAGYSGLRQITALHPAYLKLDHDLVRGIEDDARRQAMIEALVGYAERTASRIVAEGVETEAEYRALVALGVPLLQGYLLGRPEAPWPAATVPVELAATA